MTVLQIKQRHGGNSSCIKTLLDTEKQRFNKKFADLSGDKRGI